MSVRLTGFSPSDVARLVDAPTYARGTAYWQQGRVTRLGWDPDDLVLSARVRGTGARTYTTRAYLTAGPHGPMPEAGACSCPVGVDCKHVVAVFLAALGTPGTRPTPPTKAAAAPAWQRSLDQVMAAAASTPVAPAETTPLGLQVRVDGLVRDAARRRAAGERALTISIRPVRRGAKGTWSAGWDVSWDALRREYYADRWEPRSREWLSELGALRGQGFWGSSDWTPLGEFPGRLLWPHLERGRGLGVPFVGTAARDVVVLAGGTELVVDATRSAGELRLAPQLLVDGVLDAAALRGAAGDHGLFTVRPGESNGWVVTLGPAPGPLSPAAATLLAVDGDLSVPEPDEPRLMREYLPTLRQQVTLTSSDASVTFPEPATPTLVLTAAFEGAAKATVLAGWMYSTPDGVADARHHPFAPSAADAVARDLPVEREIVERVEAAYRAAGLAEATLVERLEVTGLGALDLALEILPALDGLEGVEVRVLGRPDYAELTATPQIALAARDAEDADWFDLAVTVTVDGHDVPLGNILEALSRGKKRLLLADGSWLRLNHPSLERLRVLLDEADRLSDRRGRLQVTRHQAALWDELAEVADVVEQADAWRESVGGLLALTAGEQAPAAVKVPASVTATLRPYQQHGFEWLAFCWEHRLGGILADDMGLGKTLQALALFAHARERDPDAPPFLVVAPASVVGNWAAEAARFTPHLRVAVRPATSARAGTRLADAAAGADVVLTSYAVFRLENAEFAALGWSGLVLDEAQFVKNHATRANQHARALRAPFKLAITGTPLENNVTELWALLAVVAPGLFGSLQRYREDYVRPIEAAHRPDADARMRQHSRDTLARLQRRVRPLMLRRTKEQVAPELPERQEQVVAVDLAQRHRTVYDTHLQRERKRVLGLLEDFEANRVAVFRALTTLRRMALDASLVDPVAYARVPSSKLDALFEQLPEVVAEGHRALVFSQFTSYLDLVAQRCREAGIEYAYLDGSTRNRPAVIEGFKEGEAPLFLISLKAGGFGLNLTEADYVYLLDPWWNPATEAQAVDRTHRIGQDKPVMVVRLVASGTIEEKVMALKDRKARLVDAVLDDDAERFAGAIDAADVRALFE